MVIKNSSGRQQGCVDRETSKRIFGQIPVIEATMMLPGGFFPDFFHVQHRTQIFKQESIPDLGHERCQFQNFENKTKISGKKCQNRQFAFYSLLQILVIMSIFVSVCAVESPTVLDVKSIAQIETNHKFVLQNTTVIAPTMTPT